MNTMDYIKEIEKVARSQVGVHFGEKSPYRIREILRLCEAAQRTLAPDVANPWGLDDAEMQEGEWVGDEGDR